MTLLRKVILWRDLRFMEDQSLRWANLEVLLLTLPDVFSFSVDPHASVTFMAQQISEDVMRPKDSIGHRGQRSLLVVEAFEDSGDFQAINSEPMENSLNPDRGFRVDCELSPRSVSFGWRPVHFLAHVPERDCRHHILLEEKSLVGCADILRVLRTRHLIDQGMNLQRKPPTVVFGSVDPGLHEYAPEATLDNLFLHELHALVILAEKPIGGEYKQNLSGLPIQDVAHPIKAGPAFLAPTGGQIEEDVFTRDKYPVFHREFEDAANLVTDAMLEFGGVASVGDADGGGLFPR